MSGKQRARPFVKLFTSAGSSHTVLDLSSDALAVWCMALVNAGVEQADGVVSVAPKHVARWSGRDVSVVAAAVSELVAAGLLDLRGGGKAYVSGWEQQVSEDQLSAGRAAAADRSKKYRARKAVAESPAVESAAEQSVPKPGSAAERRAGVLAVCDEAGDGSSEFYRTMLMECRKINVEAAEQGIVMKDSYLLNAVLAHCVEQTFEGRIQQKEFPSLFRLALQVGYEPIIFALTESCSKPDLTPGKEINYVIRVAKNKAAELARVAQ